MYKPTATTDRTDNPRHNARPRQSGKYKLICKIRHRAYIGQTSGNLTLRYREHILYIKNNDHQPVYALHILQNIHENGSLKDSMSLLKPIHKTPMLIPYEQLLIQASHQNRNLITEQNCGEHNPLFLLATHYSLT